MRRTFRRKNKELRMLRLIPRFLRRTCLRLGAAALAATAAMPAARAANPMLDKYPTSAVNATGLAVTDDVVTVGQLHSVSGTMALSETGSVEAERLAISQINEAGGVLGRKIEIVQEDGASDWP